ncbi:MAG TPA: dienelactone hydrolase family protein [Steroidobacteraceae bacterium]|nr:dienelactone hydrolase family protein [Steroidobacteraceae bacterium]
MGQTVQLTAGDGHRFAAYRTAPAGTPRGGLVIVQEIFGVTRHMRDVADQYAGLGYVSVVPAMFDRVEPGIELPYTEIARGRDYAGALRLDQTLLDVKAALDAVASFGKTGVVGFCWGGTIAYLAACETPIAAAVSYYGGRITQYLDRKPRCPVMYHFGEQDRGIPLTAVEQVRAAHPEGIFHLYPAGHGFNCTERADYEAASAKLAFERTREFLARHVG